MEATTMPADHTVESPIFALRELIDRASETVAPERIRDLEALMEKHGIKRTISSDRYEITCDPDTGAITLGVTALEHLWASALFYYVLYEEYGIAQRSGADKFDTGANKRVSGAMDLLNWAMNNWLGWTRKKSPLRWPPNLPRPLNPPPDKSDVHVANELFRYALAWTLHHEIAHITLGHPKAHSILSRDEERAADRHATNWLLAEAPDDRHKRLRTVGAIVGILALDTLEAALHDPDVNSHPRAYQRLSFCLDSYDAPEDDEAFAFALCGMQFNLNQRGSSSVLDGTSFRDILDHYFVAMSRATSSR